MSKNSHKPSRAFAACLPILLAGLAWWAIKQSPQAQAEPLIFSGQTMGTTYQIKVVDTNLDRAQIEKLINAQLDLVNQAMSTYRADSEISRFNDARSTLPMKLSAPTVEVIAQALEINQLSGGAFDPTVGALVRLWGFHKKQALSTAPSPETIAAARASVGCDKLVLDHKAATLQKTRPDLQVDLAAIAKGRAVDLISEALTSLGARHHMVEIGGEVRCQGQSPRHTPWRVGIERPDAGLRDVYRALELSDQSLATSGDYRSFYLLNGQRISHTIDPRTGHPITHKLASVTVILPDCMSADAWATALNVLGPVAGLALAEKLKLPALFITRNPDQSFTQQSSTHFSALFPSPPEKTP